MAQLVVEDRAAWRRWLSRNHQKKQEIFLVFFKKATGKATISYGEAVEEALCFGWIDGLKQSLDDERYTFRFTPRKKKSKWSASNKKRVAALMAAGRMAPAGLAAVEEAKRNGSWDAPSRPPVPTSIPEELAAALGKGKARRAFDALAPSHRLQWMQWVADAKRAETRVRRAKKAAALLRDGEKTPRA